MSQQELTGKITGIVEAVNDQDSKPYYGVHINGQWFNGSESTDISKGDKVELEISNDEDEFIDIVDKTILEESEGQKEERGSSTGQSAQTKNGDKPSANSSNTFQTQKSKDITVKVATKLAVENSTVKPEKQARHLNEVNELASGYIGIMQGLRKDMEQGKTRTLQRERKNQ